jgi:phosphoenolpyruvate-protein phosphotransferase (PTS system enzyme I)
MKGIGVAPGMNVGKAIWWRKENEIVTSYPIMNIDQEVAKLQQAIAQARAQISQLHHIVAERIGEDEATVFAAHNAFLDDPAFTGEMKDRIRSQQKNAAFICQEVTQEMVQLFATLDDEYMRARADDIRDVGKRLLLLLAGKTPFHPSLLQSDSVVISEELTPSETAQFPRGMAGMITARGSKTSHAAIIARTLGIPAVFGVGEAIQQIKEEDIVVVDGNQGEILLHPSTETEQMIRAQMKQQAQVYKQAIMEAAQATYTADGRRIEVFANIGNLQDVEPALMHHAEGVGLFRTEFLYLENDHWPTEEEQVQIYSQVLQAFGQQPVIIRTLDIGGDKHLPYAKLPNEENPFLGQRAIRYCLTNPPIFKTQLRALLRASVDGTLWILLPMIENLAEIRATKSLLSQCRQELQQQGLAVVATSIPLGIMVETPAAAITADLLAQEVDFISIGTNDLTQYTLAADRNNERVAHLYDSAHPAVLRLIQMTCEAGRQAGIVVGLCGELAADPEMTEVLLGLGLRELSMGAGRIPEIKQKVRQIHLQAAKQLANQCLHLASGEQVKEHIKKRNQDNPT